MISGNRTRDIWEAVQKNGLSARTVQRAKRALGIESRRAYADGWPVSYWLLPGQGLPRDPTGDEDVMNMFADLEKRYPGPTPLDEDDSDGDPD